MKEFLKILKNYRWEVRCKNLEKKYNLLLEENQTLKKKLDEDFANKIIKDKNKMIKRQKQIIKNLREDYKKITSQEKTKRGE